MLFRDGWGKTRWTAVEETAIKERAFNSGWEFLLFVMLEKKDSPPPWLPEIRIRLNYADYGDALPGAIKMRAQELGSDLKAETLAERAARLQGAETARADRLAILTSKGAVAFQAEHTALRGFLDASVREIQPKLTTVKIESAGDGSQYVVRTDKVSFNFYIYPTFPVTDSKLVVQHFNRPLILPGTRDRMYIPGEEPRVREKSEFMFDYQPGPGWCWHPRSKMEMLLSTAQLGERLLKGLLDRHDSAEDRTEKIARRPVRYRMQ